MFRYWQDILFLLTLSAYWINRFVIKPHLPEGEVFFHGYFNDLLLVPVALPLVLLLLRLVGARRHDLFPTMIEVLMAVVVWSILFELIGPELSDRAIGDPYDVLAYTVGGLLSYFIWNRRSMFGDVTG